MAMTDDFKRGFIVCLSNMVHSNGVTVCIEERFGEIDEPSAKEMKRLKMDTYDKEAMSLIRKSLREMRKS